MAQDKEGTPGQAEVLLPTIGRYEVTAVLGQGGMAEAFLGRLTGPGGFSKQVVIKRLLPQLSGQGNFDDMFMDEARISARLSHPNIVQVYEIGESDGLPYMVMEFLNGPTASLLVKRQLDEDQVDWLQGCRVVHALAGALSHAHAVADDQGTPLNVVHRDVTPQNIIITVDGVVKLLDFGVAMADSRMAKTKTGVIKGKAAYMAPEQVTGGAVDARTDVFACGVCLYYFTTGKRPFRGTAEFAVLSAVVAGTFERPTAVRADLPPQLEAIIIRAMAPSPSERYQTAEDLRAALGDFLARAAPGSDSQKSLSKWVRGTFPNWDTELRKRIDEGRAWATSTPSGRWGITPSSPSMQRPSSEMLKSPLTPAGSERRRWPLVAGALAVLVAIAAVGLALRGTTAPPAPPLPPVTTVPAVAAPAVPGSQAVDVYLTEVERLVGLKRYSQARELVGRARAVEEMKPEQAVRLAALAGELETGEAFAGAERSAREGQSDEAIESLKQVLELDPQHAEASKMLAALVETRSAGSRDARGGRAARQGSLTVTSVPDAQLYVDDVPHGTTPLKKLKLSPGRHTVELRKEGHLPAQREVNVRAGKPVVVALKLEVRPRAEPAADALVAVRPRAGVSPIEPPLAAASNTAPASAETPSTETAGTRPAGTKGPGPVVTPDAPKVVAVAATEVQGPAVGKVEEKAPSEVAAVVAPTAPAPPRLPASHTAFTSQEVTRVLGIIEGEIAKRGGIPAAFASGVTVPLAQRLISEFSPGSAVVLAPRSTYYLVVDGHRQGLSRQEVADRLKRAHFDGSLARYRAK